jgi:hypothetical protein
VLSTATSDSYVFIHLSSSSIRKKLETIVIFNEKMHVKIVEVDHLRATSHSTRYFLQNSSLAFVLPYMSIDIDDLVVGCTNTKEKTT